MAPEYRQFGLVQVTPVCATPASPAAALAELVRFAGRVEMCVVSAAAAWQSVQTLPNTRCGSWLPDIDCPEPLPWQELHASAAWSQPTDATERLWQAEVVQVPAAPASFGERRRPSRYVTAAAKFVLPLMCVATVAAAWQSVHGMFVYCVCSLCAFVIIAAPFWWHSRQLVIGVALPHWYVFASGAPRSPELWHSLVPHAPAAVGVGISAPNTPAVLRTCTWRTPSMCAGSTGSVLWQSTHAIARPNVAELFMWSRWSAEAG